MGGRDLSAAAVPEELRCAKIDRLELAGWIVLGLLLAATLGAALTFSREGRPGLVGDEATYAMQAASLAWDFDLVYTRADYDRFVEHWGGPHCMKGVGLVAGAADSAGGVARRAATRS